jgi:hypothetical protein
MDHTRSRVMDGREGKVIVLLVPWIQNPSSAGQARVGTAGSLLLIASTPPDTRTGLDPFPELFFDGKMAGFLRNRDGGVGGSGGVLLVFRTDPVLCGNVVFLAIFPRSNRAITDISCTPPPCSGTPPDPHSAEKPVLPGTAPVPQTAPPPHPAFTTYRLLKTFMG